MLKGISRARHATLVAAGILDAVSLRRVRAGGSWPSDAQVISWLKDKMKEEELLHTRYKELVERGGDPDRA